MLYLVHKILLLTHDIVQCVSVKNQMKTNKKLAKMKLFSVGPKSVFHIVN